MRTQQHGERYSRRHEGKPFAMTSFLEDTNTLSPEEAYLWQCARDWRRPLPPPDPQALDWSRVVATGVHNRMPTLLQQVLQETGSLPGLPAALRSTLEAEADRLAESAEIHGAALKAYLNRAAGRGLETVVHKGLSTSLNLYGDTAMRPGGDIDILVRKEDVAESLEILEQLGIGRNWPNLLDDRYYTR